VLKISIASGKGGTGKTTIATNLAAALAKKGLDVAYVDCDVEEPNGHIFLKPALAGSRDVSVMIPEVDLEKCTFCGECAEICEFNAIAVVKDNVMVFPSLCHNCGGCYHICPEKAIYEVPRNIGVINDGTGHKVRFMEGRLNIGESQAPPITREIKKIMPQSQVVVIDAPPGTSCPVIEAVNSTDYVILVTEPTPFGLNDLKLAVGMVRELDLPFGVVINRSDMGDDRTEKYCRDEKIEVLMRLPFDRRIATAYSWGGMLPATKGGYGEKLYGLYRAIAQRVGND
jgi:MinD superfamily P-loop ATPase